MMTTETFVRTDDVMTFAEARDFYEMDDDEMPPSPMSVCAGEWRIEGPSDAPVWRFWRDPTF